jgi:hypothetical protein
MHTKITSHLTLRENDKFIMDLAYKQGLSLKILRYINQCRMNLQALTLTDTTNEIGTIIEPQFYVWKEVSPRKTTITATTLLP